MGFADDLGGELGSGWMFKDTNPGDYLEGFVTEARVAAGTKYKSEETEKKLVVQVDATGGLSGGVEVEPGPCRILASGGRAGAVGRCLDKAMRAAGLTEPAGLLLSVTYTGNARSTQGSPKKCWRVKVFGGDGRQLAEEVMK